MQRAERLKAAANDHFRAKEYREAIQGYSDAIFTCEAFAFPPRELLSILFSNR